MLIFKGQAKLTAQLQIVNKHNTVKHKTFLEKDTAQVSWWLYIRPGLTRVQYYRTILIQITPSHICMKVSYICKFHMCIQHLTDFGNYSKEICNMKPLSCTRQVAQLNAKSLLPRKSQNKDSKNPDCTHQTRAQQALGGCFEGWWSIESKSNRCSALENSRQLHTVFSFSCIMFVRFHQI